MTAEAMLKIILKELDERKAVDVEVLEVSKLTPLADYFVVCSGTSSTHLKGLADGVQKKLKEDAGLMPHHVEGYPTASWILMDFGQVLIHLFLSETREFYSLERLWRDASKIDREKLDISES
jgi:ribosome-associated protein